MPNHMFNVKWHYPIKNPLPLLIGVRNVKTTYRKSWPENLFQVLNLTLDHCFKVRWGHHTKHSCISLIIASRTSECKAVHGKSWPLNDVPVKILISFRIAKWPVIADCLKVIKMLSILKYYN